MLDVSLIKPTADGVAELLKEKNTAYGSSVEMTYEIFGLEAYLVRMYDKINRLTNLTKNGGNVNDEKIQDSLRDLAGYAILAIVQLESEENVKPRKVEQETLQVRAESYINKTSIDVDGIGIAHEPTEYDIRL